MARPWLSADEPADTQQRRTAVAAVTAAEQRRSPQSALPRLVWPAAVLLAAVLTGFVAARLVAVGDGVFTTPDESGNYLTATALVERGTFLLEPYGTEVDPENALGPLSAVRVDDGFAPYQTPLTAVLQAAGVSATGSSWLGSFLLAAAGTVGLMFSLRRLGTGGVTAPIVVFASCTPILYWIVHQYGTAGTYLAVEPWAIYFAIRAWGTGSRTAAIAAALFHALALIARPDFTVATSLVVVVFAFSLAPSQGRARWYASILGLLAVAGVLAAIAMLVNNAALYGDPLLVGPAVLRERFGASSVADVSDANPLSFLVKLAFPQGSPELELWPRSVYKYLLYTAPVFTGLSVYGFVVLLRGNRDARRLAMLLAVVIVFAMLSRLQDGLDDALGWSPSPRGSISRYWLPAYLLMGGFAVFGVERLQQRVGAMTVAYLVPVVAALAVVGIGVQYSGVSLRYEIGRLDRSDALATRIAAVIDDDSAIVYSLSDDKFFAPQMRTATLMPFPGRDLEDYRPEVAIASIQRQLEGGQVVYVYSRNRQILSPLLRMGGLVPTEEAGLYRATSAGPAVPP